jgi:hypothetical protein
MSERFKIVVFVPEVDAEAVRAAMARAGAGVIGDYTHCTFSSPGVGRFLPGEGARPAIGEVGRIEAVAEARIETVCAAVRLSAALAAIRAAHPYEEPAIDVYALVEM